MELLLLDYETFYPTQLFEGYSSLIWTERFMSSGEFKLISSKIEETITAMPLGSFISLRDTSEVMIVENYSIEPNKSDGSPELTVSGRSLDSFLEHRALLPTEYGKSWNTMQSYSAQQLIGLLLWNSFVNSSEEDPTRPYSAFIPQPDPYLVVPNLVVSLATPLQNHGYQTWALSAGQVDTIVSNLQKTWQIGIRAIRPQIDNTESYEMVDVDVARTYSRGTINLTTVVNDTKNIRFDVYLGTDRTITQTEVNPVVFNHALGDILDPSYLRSIKNYKQYTAVASDSGSYHMPYIESGPDYNLVEPWQPNRYYPPGSMVEHNGDIYIADLEPPFGQEPGTESEPITTSYLDYLENDGGVATLFSFDEIPTDPMSPIVDISGNYLNGSLANTDGELREHEPIFGNGKASIETVNTWVTVDGALEDHDSWTITCLAKDVDENGLGWIRGGTLAARPFSPFSYPWWEMNIDNGRLQGGYITEWTNRMYTTASETFTSNSEHVLTVRYNATTFTLSIFVDGTMVSELVLPTHPVASTPSQKLQFATSTLYIATSHWAYWTHALESSTISEMHEVAMNGGIETPGPDNAWSLAENEAYITHSSTVPQYVGSFNYSKIGFNRRVLFVDGDSLNYQDIVTLTESELTSHSIFSMADGEISHTSPYVYGRDYFLGDIVTFSSVYEINTPMCINEIVRTEDINGESIFPGITSIASNNIAIYNG